MIKNINRILATLTITLLLTFQQMHNLEAQLVDLMTNP